MLEWLTRLVGGHDLPEPEAIIVNGDLCLTFDAGTPLKILAQTIASKSPALAEELQVQKRLKPKFYKGIPRLNLALANAEVMRILCYVLHAKYHPNPADSRMLATLAREGQNLSCVEAITPQLTLWLKEHAKVSEDPISKTRQLFWYDVFTSYVVEHHEEFMRATSALVISHTGPFQLLRNIGFGHLLPNELFIMLNFKRTEVYQSLFRELRLAVQPFSAARPRSFREDKISIEHIGVSTPMKILNQIMQWESALTDLSTPVSVLDVVAEIEALTIPTIVEATNYDDNDISVYLHDRVQEILANAHNREKSGVCLAKLQNSTMAHVDCSHCPKVDVKVVGGKRRRNLGEVGGYAKEAKPAGKGRGKKRKLNADEIAADVQGNANVEQPAEDGTATVQGSQDRDLSPEL